jgi:iron complex transport system substrate-binding protein
MHRCLFLILIVTFIFGCHSTTETTNAPAKAGNHLTLRDDLGRDVRIPQPVQRIVSLAPACTETLFAIGADKQVVAVTTFDNYPPEAAQKERIGGFSRETVSLEKIVALKPDVIFSSGSLQRDLIEDLERLGLVVFALEPSSYDDVGRAVKQAGEITGHQQQAQKVADELRASGEEIRKKVAAIPADQRPRVFYQVWDKPLRTAGSQSFLGQLIEIAGGQNVFADVQDAYPLVNEEAVIQRNPQIILAPAHEGTDMRSFTDRSAWSTISAVREKRIYFFDEDVISRPGPRISQALRDIARTLHPSLFDEPKSPEPEA